LTFDTNGTIYCYTEMIMKDKENKTPQNLRSNEVKKTLHIRASKDVRDELYTREKNLKREDYFFNLQDQLTYLK